MPERVVNKVSGHSTRVGATQDLATLDVDLAAITQAGGWKSTRMPLHYAEKINAGRSGMARAAAASGRDEEHPRTALKLLRELTYNLKRIKLGATSELLSF
jgi:hypothetical protein